MAVRSADPCLVIDVRWVFRRIGPDAFNIEDLDLRTHEHQKNVEGTAQSNGQGLCQYSFSIERMRK